MILLYFIFFPSDFLYEFQNALYLIVMICLLSRDAFRKEDYDTLRSESILFCVPPFSVLTAFAGCVILRGKCLHQSYPPD